MAIVVVAGASNDVGRRVVSELASGHGVIEVPEAVFSTSTAARQAFERATPTEPVDAVVHALDVAGLWQARPLAATSSTEWFDTCESVLTSTLWVLQAAHRLLHERGGRVVVFVPTAGMSGEQGYVAASTAGEGQRALVKSAARQWGGDGIVANCIACPIESRHGLAGTTVPALPSSDPAVVAAMLCGPDAGHLTGQTITVDAGAWMP